MLKALSLDIDRYRTPHKLKKPVIAPSGQQGAFDSHGVDCPFVFYHQGKFQMLYIGFDGKSYQTALAESDDLIHWKHKGVILKRERGMSWDSVGQAGTWILKDTNSLFELPTLRKVDGKYWMIYHSYPGEGYEVGPAETGLAWTEDEDLLEWERLPQPILSWKGGMDWERGGLYKSCFIEDQGTYYQFYNAKNVASPWTEQTGVGLSQDLMQWERHTGNPVVGVTEGSWDSCFASDPCVLRDGDLWLMFYFGYDRKHAQAGLAVSKDLLTWQKYPDPLIRHGNEEELDEIHAHKSSVIYFSGTLYHFYCSVRRRRKGDPALHDSEYRCITVATSKPVSV